MKAFLSRPSALSVLDELRCGVVRPRHSANFIRLNGATSLRLVLSVVVTVMSSEICERKSVYGRQRGLVRNIKRGKRGTAGGREGGEKEMSNWRAPSLNVSTA